LFITHDGVEWMGFSGEIGFGGSAAGGLVIGGGTRTLNAGTF
jgi:hypothetical protein